MFTVIGLRDAGVPDRVADMITAVAADRMYDMCCQARRDDGARWFVGAAVTDRDGEDTGAPDGDFTNVAVHGVSFEGPWDTGSMRSQIAVMLVHAGPGLLDDEAGIVLVDLCTDAHPYSPEWDTRMVTQAPQMTLPDLVRFMELPVDPAATGAGAPGALYWSRGDDARDGWLRGALAARLAGMRAAGPEDRIVRVDWVSPGGGHFVDLVHAGPGFAQEASVRIGRTAPMLSGTAGPGAPGIMAEAVLTEPGPAIFGPMPVAVDGWTPVTLAWARGGR